MTAKVPAAVVYLERPDGRVLALTREQDYADWHYIGGKWEPKDGFRTSGGMRCKGWRDGSDRCVLDVGHDGLCEFDALPPHHNLTRTIIRETQEESGLLLTAANLLAIHQYTTTHNPERPGSGGRPVTVFLAQGCTWYPEHFARYKAGQPAWVPREMLTMPSSKLRHEAQVVLDAVVMHRHQQQDWVP
jgi:8-oxo-dGTP pyrophosphatase MutT (NUDIX family)